MFLTILICICALGPGINSETSKTEEIPECSPQLSKDSRLYHVSGINELPLRYLDPFYLPKLSVSRKNSPIAYYDLYEKYVILTGASRYQVLTNYLNSKELLIKLKILFPTLKWSITGLVEGQVLNYAVNNTHSGFLDFKNLSLDFVLDGSEYLLYGRRFITWREGSIEVSYDHLSATVYDLFDDPDRMEAFNNEINQNIHLLEEHIKPLIENSVGRFIIDSVNKIHRTYSADVLDAIPI